MANLLSTVAIALVVSSGAQASDRDLLHRNGQRGIAYETIAVPGAPSSSAPLRGVPVREIALDGDGTVNVRGNIYPIDVDKDGTWELLHFNGYRLMRVLRQDGTKLWQIGNPDGRVHRDNVHRDTLAIIDVDGDGDQDIVHCWSAPGSQKRFLVARAGRTGQVIRQIPLPGTADSECQIAVFNMQGAGTTIFVAANANPDANCHGNFIDRWARTLAFNLSFAKRWERSTCESGHYLWPVGAGPGRTTAAVAIGKYIVDSAGKLICTLKEFGKDHVDSMAVGDLDPASPGLEIVAVGATGTRAYGYVPGKPCRFLWSIPNSVIPGQQHAIMAKLDPSSPGLSVAIRTEGSMQAREGTYLVDRHGHVLRFNANQRFAPVENANLDGALGTDELAGGEGWVMGPTGNIRLDDTWYRKLDHLSASEQRLSRYDQWTYRPVWFDLQGDGRDELITWGRHMIVIGRIGF
ncbi:MAG: hypothetical protein U1E45_17500 [Geminicoccaceae bacterium]